MSGLGLLSPCAYAQQPAPDLAAGRAAYLQSCARCHGVDGKGDGRDAKRLYPKPRDFTSGVYKFRSTAGGSAPTDDDLFQTITDGLTSGGMPDWRHLDEALQWQMVYYLKSLSSRFQDNPPQPVNLGKDPGSRHLDLARGRQVYEKLGCAACHGASGRANGASAAGLVDDWGRPLRPADLTQGWNYRRGDEPGAIVQRILAGIDGAPMPSYAEAASPEEAWQLAYYVRSLQEEPRWAVMVRAAHVVGPLPESPADPAWKTVERVDVRLRNTVDAASGEMKNPQTVTAVSLQTVYNDHAVSLRLSWHDPSESRLPAATGTAQAGTGQVGADPADAIALALRPAGVNGDVITLQTWPLRDSPALDLCLWSAARQQAREAVVKSYEPLLQGGEGVPIASQAAYEDGQWTLVMTRFLAPADITGAAQLAPGRFIPMAFSVWDGGNAGQQTISPWVDVALQPPPVAPPKSDHSLTLVWVVSGVVLVLAGGFMLRRA